MSYAESLCKVLSDLRTDLKEVERDLKENTEQGECLSKERYKLKEVIKILENMIND